MKKFFIGCGVLTGIGILLLVGTSFFAVRWFKSNAPDLDRLDRYETELTDRFGQVADFVPPAQGAYDPERARLYVKVRRRLHEIGAPLRSRIQSDVDKDSPSHRGLRKFVAGLKSGAAYLRDSFEYIAAADSILLEADMGRGEYVHWTGLLVRGGLSIRGSDYLDFDVDADDRGPLQALGVEFEEDCRRVFLRQFDALRSAKDDDPWVQLVLDERARVRHEDGLWPFTGKTLPEPLDSIFAEVETELRRTAPQDAAGLLLDNVLGARIDDDRGSWRVEFDR